jgi:hypothetical protein
MSDSTRGYFMFGKYNGFVSKARVSACMYFLVDITKIGVQFFLQFIYGFRRCGDISHQQTSKVLPDQDNLADH